MAVPPPSPATKPAMRARLRAARRDHARELAAAGTLAAATQAAVERLLRHIPAGAAVALYHARAPEPDPAHAASALAAAGHALALPHVPAGGGAMRLLAWAPGDPLETGALGIPQPLAAAPALAPTVIVTPLVGFDRGGGRLGQGAAYYDRAFAALPGAVRIGLAWSVQEVAQVPRDPWDVPLHAIATECEWIVAAEATR